MTKILALLLLLSAPLSTVAQANPTPLPPNYQTILANDSFRVIRVHYGPHEKVPVHDHPDVPTVYVYLNNSGPLKIIHDETPPAIITRPPTHTGAFRVSRGRVERHAIENLSDLPSDFLRVELPTLHLGETDLEFRGSGPTDLTKDRDTTEFSSSHVSVVRIVCVTSACTIPPSTSPSVLVAISNSSTTSGGQTTKLAPGSVLTIPLNQSLKINPITATEPAHVLEVTVTP